MNYQEFRCEFLERIKEVMDEDICVTTEDIKKNNGIVLDGMILKRKGSRTAPVFYLQDYFAYWEKGVPMEQLVRKVLWQFTNCFPDLNAEADDFSNYEKVKENICFKLINYERNRELLKRAPHRRILDLAMVFYYRVRKGDQTKATTLVEHRHVKEWGISEEELEENAKSCTYQSLPAEFINMRGILGLEKQEGKQMYVLTNVEKSYGAGVFLYPEVLRQAERLLGERFYVLPSSIHECILVPEDDSFDQESLTATVTEINESQLDPREVLSDQAYVYNGQDGKVHL